MAAAHGCVVAADRRAMSTASHSRERKPQRALVGGEPVFIHRRKDGAQGWCGPGVCVLSEEQKPGRNETVWVHMRNCLHKCNRTQVRPATNEEVEGIETVTSLLPSLTEAVRERDTSPTSPTRGILKTMSQQLWKVMSWTFAWEGQICSRNLISMYRPIPTRRHTVPDQELMRRPRPRPRLQPALTWRSESVIAGFDFVKKESPRDIIWTHPSDRESLEEPRGKMPRRTETSESVVPFQSSEASSSERQKVSTAVSDNSIGERL